MGLETLDKLIERQVELLVKGAPSVVAVINRWPYRYGKEKRLTTTIQVGRKATYEPIITVELDGEDGYVRYADIKWPLHPCGEPERIEVYNKMELVLPVLCFVEAAICQAVRDPLGLCQWFNEKPIHVIGPLLDYEEVSPTELYAIYLTRNRKAIQAAVVRCEPDPDDPEGLVWSEIIPEFYDPPEHRCPRRLLDRLTPAGLPEAQNWRDRCYEWALSQETADREHSTASTSNET